MIGPVVFDIIGAQIWKILKKIDLNFAMTPNFGKRHQKIMTNLPSGQGIEFHHAYNFHTCLEFDGKTFCKNNLKKNHFWKSLSTQILGFFGYCQDPEVFK